MRREGQLLGLGGAGGTEVSYMLVSTKITATGSIQYITCSGCVVPRLHGGHVKHMCLSPGHAPCLYRTHWVPDSLLTVKEMASSCADVFTVPLVRYANVS